MARAGDSDIVLGRRGLFHRSEFIHIIIQALSSLGYGRVAAALEEDSGVPLYSLRAAKGLRDSILSGDWDGAIHSLSSLWGSLPSEGGEGEREQKKLKMASFILLQAKLEKIIEEGDSANALKTLRTQISPLGINTKWVHSVAFDLVFCPTPPPAKTRNRRNNEEKLEGESGIYNNYNNDNDNSSRLEILKNVQSLLPAPTLVEERRLEELVEQALTAQIEHCIYHNSMDRPLSLYQNHFCCSDQIPTCTHQVLERHKDEVWFLQFSNNGKYLASASKDNTAIIWEVINGNQVKFKHMLKGHEKPVSLVAWSPDDTMLLTCGNEETIQLWDTKTGEYKSTFKALHTLKACAWFPCSKRFATGGRDRCIRIWDTENTRNGGRPISTRESMVSELAIIWRGRCLLMVCESDIWIHYVEEEVGDGKEEVLITEDKPITSLSINRDESFLLTSLDNEIHLWNIERDIAEFICKYDWNSKNLFVIRSCFGGWNQMFIASGSEDSQVYIWHQRCGWQPLCRLGDHSGTVNCVTWNPTNPQMLASASNDHTIRIWGNARSANLNLGNDVNTN